MEEVVTVVEEGSLHCGGLFVHTITPVDCHEVFTEAANRVLLKKWPLSTRVTLCVSLNTGEVWSLPAYG